MRARWLLWGLLLCSCKGQERAPAPGSAVSAVATLSDASVDAPAVRLDIACGPAMLSPRIPAPPKPKSRPTGTYRIGPGDSSFGLGVDAPGAGGGKSVNQDADGFGGGGQGLRGVSRQPKPQPSKPKPAPAPPPPTMDVRSWTPFAASQGLASDDVAKAAGDELVQAMPRAKLDRCFAGKPGSERVMVQVAFDGAVIGARSGGSGDAQVDACIGASLIGLKVTAPPTVTELACDITRGGDPLPWRVAVESYTVIDVTPTEIREAGAAIGKDKLVPQKGDNTRAFLVVVDPKAPAELLVAVFDRTAWSTATLVALKSDAGAPVFIGMGRDGRTRDPDYAPLLAITADGDSIKSCTGAVGRGTAPKAEAATLLQTLAQSCDPKPCPASLSISLAGTMQDLATYADAARHAQLPRLELSTTDCP